MKKRNVLIATLIMLAMVVSGFTYAYWAGSVEGSEDTNNGSVEIGHGTDLTTTVTAVFQASTGTLVPKEYVVDGETVGEVELTADVNWGGQGAAGTIGTLTMETISIKTVGDEFDASDIFKVTYLANGAQIIAGTPIEAKMTFEFKREPDNKAEYDKIKNAEISIEVQFTVTVNNN